MDYWKGPHSKIISATPGFEEDRQIHLAENNPGLWPAISGVETVIPSERSIDGVPRSHSPRRSPRCGAANRQARLQGRSDVFRRTLLYAGPPRSARWYDVARPEEKAGARSLTTCASARASRLVRSESSSPASSCPRWRGRAR